MRWLAGAMIFTLTGASCAGDEKAADAAAAVTTTEFSGETALGYVKAQLDFGSRVPGSQAHSRAGEWLVAQFRERADTVIEQRWTHRTIDGKSLPMRNVLARFKPDATRRLLFLAHWDSRPVSDAAEDPAQRSIPVPGANDGASGVAVLLALADALKATPPEVGIDLLLVDGEDYGNFTTNTDVLIGSTHFAANPPSPDYAIEYGVLLDMIGDADLRIPYEEHSINAAPNVVQKVWAKAQAMGYGGIFVPQNMGPVTDDHIPLLRKGWKVINVIDIDYCCHHKPTDTIDKVSARSLKIVGDVMLSLIRDAR
jgi:glutaminyl-peptide cyclotransferase